MRLTRRKALEICKELWGWLRDNPDKRPNECDEGRKSRWPGWEKYGELRNLCPCCEYSAQHGFMYCADTCLIANVWGGGVGDSCLTPGKPYNAWCAAETPRIRKKYAQQIVDGCIEALAKLPKRKAKAK